MLQVEAQQERFGCDAKFRCGLASEGHLPDRDLTRGTEGEYENVCTVLHRGRRATETGAARFDRGLLLAEEDEVFPEAARDADHPPATEGLEPGRRRVLVAREDGHEVDPVVRTLEMEQVLVLLEPQECLVGVCDAEAQGVAWSVAGLRDVELDVYAVGAKGRVARAVGQLRGLRGLLAGRIAQESLAVGSFGGTSEALGNAPPLPHSGLSAADVISQHEVAGARRVVGAHEENLALPVHSGASLARDRRPFWEDAHERVGVGMWLTHVLLPRFVDGVSAGHVLLVGEGGGRRTLALLCLVVEPGAALSRGAAATRR